MAEKKNVNTTSYPEHSSPVVSEPPVPVGSTTGSPHHSDIGLIITTAVAAGLGAALFAGIGGLIHHTVTQHQTTSTPPGSLGSENGGGSSDDVQDAIDKAIHEIQNAFNPSTWFAKPTSTPPGSDSTTYTPKPAELDPSPQPYTGSTSTTGSTSSTTVGKSISGPTDIFN